MKENNKLFISLICNFIYLAHAKFISRNRYHWLSSVAATDPYSTKQQRGMNYTIEVIGSYKKLNEADREDPPKEF